MQRKMWMAVIIAISLLVYPVFGQGDRPVTVDTSGQNGASGSRKSGSVGGYTPAPKNQPRTTIPAPNTQPKTPVTTTDDQKGGKPGCTGYGGSQKQTWQPPATPSRKARSSKRSPRKTAPVGHEKEYQEVKDWNPASGSYVDARDAKTLASAKAYSDCGDEKTLEQAKQYTDEMTTSKNQTGQPPKSKGATHPMTNNNDSNLWWILLLILIVAALIWLAFNWRRVRVWVANWLNPQPAQPQQPQQPRPVATNRASGNHSGVAIPGSTVNVFRQQRTYVRIEKGVANLRLGGNWRFASMGGSVGIDYFPGDTLVFGVKIINDGNADLATDDLCVTDLFEIGELADCCVTGGELFLNTTKIGDIDQALARRIVSGQEMCVRDLVSRIPALRTLFIRITVDTRRAGNRGGAGDIPAPDGTTAPTNGGGTPSRFDIDAILNQERQEAEERAEQERVRRAVEEAQRQIDEKEKKKRETEAKKKTKEKENKKETKKKETTKRERTASTEDEDE